jgi:hypothetical protein
MVGFHLMNQWKGAPKEIFALADFLGKRQPARRRINSFSVLMC